MKYNAEILIFSKCYLLIVYIYIFHLDNYVDANMLLLFIYFKKNLKLINIYITFVSIVLI